MHRANIIKKIIIGIWGNI